MQSVHRAWAGIAAGRGHHHVVRIDEDGNRLMSRRIASAEPELVQIVDAVRALAEGVIWAIDLADGPAALLLQRGELVFYRPPSRSIVQPAAIEAKACVSSSHLAPPIVMDSGPA